MRPSVTQGLQKVLLAYEYVAPTFAPLDPYRPLEFVRDWNVAGLARTHEHLLNGTVGAAFAKYGTVSYELAALLKDTLYTGIKNAATAQYRHRGWDISAAASYLNTRSRTERTDYLRPHANISYSLPFGLAKKQKKGSLQLGVYVEGERNNRRARYSDSLQRGSTAYYLYKVYAQSNDSEQLQWNAA